MPSLMSHAVLPLLLRATRANRPFRTERGARQRLAERTTRPEAYGPPRLLRRDVRIDVERVGGWPVYTVRPRSGEPRGGVVYAHGGGWYAEIARQHWELTAQVAAQAGVAVTVPIYPLVPYGTAAQVVPAFADLVLRSEQRWGTTALAGDSAGGQIALSTAILLRDRDARTFPRTLLIAPALDLSLSNPEIDTVQPHDPWLGRDGTRVFIDLWRARLPLDDPLVSPLAADLTGLGPISLYAGTHDILWPDAKLLIARAREAGVEVDYHEQEGLVHVYPLTPTPEGRAARASIVSTLARHIEGPGRISTP
ncbi:alpha/beta hydrolase fold domain-containing protein [uncultured Arsenicicoccus sp.]|uniref:alpha/beta hydrolase fold domain-containing protein n=1 Tax=uncultured Arsenicicoccus sp. TaxID=491339 RepID=UPI002594158D|nr:alpha/beta hydrolase [uncultured Arsenicicoccus sp.]